MKNLNIYFGITLVILGVFLVIDSAELYYAYHYTDLLFLYMLPCYELIARIILGLLFISSGVLIVERKIQGLKMIQFIGRGMVIYGIYGIFRFIIDYYSFMSIPLFIEALFMGFPYIISGLILIRITNWKRFKVNFK